MSEYENEPIPGLPGIPPAGEHVLWQGAPDRRVLARTAFHTRLVTGYFVLLVGWAIASALYSGGGYRGVMMTIIVGVLGVALLHLLAWGSARTTVYTLTNRRIVLRIGIAVPKCINLPLRLISSVNLAARPDGSGDLPLAIAEAPKLGFLALWPHARPWKVTKPQPMLRALPDAADVAALIARTCLAANPEGRIAAIETRTEPTPDLGKAAVA